MSEKKFTLTEFSKSNGVKPEKLEKKESFVIHNPSGKSSFTPFAVQDKDSKYYSEEEYFKAKKKSFDEGTNLGKQQAEQEYNLKLKNIDEAGNLILEQILSFLKNSTANFEAHKRDFSINMAKIMHVSLQKILKDRISEKSSEILQKMMLDAQNLYTDFPELHIYLEGNIKNKIENKLQEKLKEIGYSGKILFVTDNNGDVNSARMEWAKAGISFNIDENIAEIDSIIGQYIKSL